jgi:hypothetical protein
MYARMERGLVAQSVHESLPVCNAVLSRYGRCTPNNLSRHAPNHHRTVLPTKLTGAAMHLVLIA